MARKAATSPLHTPTFGADDTAIPVGFRVMTNLVLEVLWGDAPEDLTADRQEG